MRRLATTLLVCAAALAAPAAAPSSSAATSAADFASQLALQTGDASAPTGGDGGSAVVADAKKYLGIPYVWGGESTSGMDCSGLVQRTFADLGVGLPRTAAEQQQVGTAVPSLAAAKPGDLLFFGTPAHHVAIYAGDNKLIESPEPGKTVHVTDVYQTPTSIRRIELPASAAGTSGGKGAADLTASGISSKVASYAGAFAAAEQAHNLPSGLLAAVAQQESGGNPNAVSGAGAQGLMQLMPSTAAGLGVNAFDPQQAIEGAAQILSRNLRHYGGSVDLALAAYNAGSGAVDRYGGIPPYSETQNYVRSITAMLQAGG
ncbi:MAG TPA: transglycosylase SLT domain-containing protein [Jatrophihabitans sp.]|nr:transglycosylase SLT domain-containing protein [Jatrophihabitans sp.]